MTLCVRPDTFEPGIPTLRLVILQRVDTSEGLKYVLPSLSGQILSARYGVRDQIDNNDVTTLTTKR